MYKIKRKLKTAWSLMEFKIKKINTKLLIEQNIYKQSFLEAIKNEIENEMKKHIKKQNR